MPIIQISVICISMRSSNEIFDSREHCIDITIDEVKSYLAKIQPDIKNDKFIVSRENEKTISFLESSRKSVYYEN